MLLNKSCQASPLDCIWGVGLHWKDDLILNSKNWKGQNKLGIALNRALEEILKTNAT